MSAVSRIAKSLIRKRGAPKLVSILNGRVHGAGCCRCFHTCNRLEAVVAFNLSDIGEGIREVTVKEWFVKVGDKVSQFDNICEVQSDKASVTITSRYDGVITKLYYPVDQIALVGKPLCDIETDDGTSETTPKAAEPLQTSSETEDSSTSSSSDEDSKDNTPISGLLTIPSVRRLAKEKNVDLSKVKATGKNGRILKEDVLNYLQIGDRSLAATKSTTTGEVSSRDDRALPLTPFQKAMVKTMSDALKIPHFVYSDEISVTNLGKVRVSVKEELGKSGIKLSYLPFFIKAASNALRKYPVLNATLDETCRNVIYKSGHNIGIAMDTKAGLAVPVIKNVQNLGILEIAKELNRLLASKDNGVFAPSDLVGGTFTLSNIGVIGGTYTKPVILPPQVAIVALGAIQRLPRFNQEGQVFPDDILCASGSADHRIVDGATMANFLTSVKMQIQNPNLLFLSL